MIENKSAFKIRQINPDSQIEIELVAKRMRETLKEVVGADRGEAMYSMEWLINRVKFHLDSNLSTGQVLVSENSEGEITGHCIYRIEKTEDGSDYGLFSTTYVSPSARRLGVANKFLSIGEAWMSDKGLRVAATATSKINEKLMNLYFKRGYQVVFTNEEMLRLEKILPVPTGQEKYLIGVTLNWQPYKATRGVLDHCEFCQEEFMESGSQGSLREGYTTVDNSHWICINCFHDFQDSFGWKI